MSAMHVTRALAVATGLALALLLFSCAFTSDLSGSLVGKVMVAGSSVPIPGALVECEGVVSVSAADGAYSLEGIPPGERAVFASADGYFDYSEVVTVEESALHDIYMAVYVGPARLFGYVRHATLGPIEGASVQLGDMNVVTDSQGYYEYPNLLQTSYFMTVTKDGYRQFSQNVHPTSEDFQFDVNVKKLATATLWSSADASVHENSPDTNSGHLPILDLFNNGFFHERFYIRFSLEGIEETAEPSTATLRLYHTQEEGDEASRTLLVARVLEFWSEGNVTWNNDPQTTGASSVQGVYELRWYEAEVASYFSDWLVPPVSANRGLLVDTPTQHEAGQFIFASRENGEEDKRPHVVLHYAW